MGAARGDAHFNAAAGQVIEDRLDAGDRVQARLERRPNLSPGALVKQGGRRGAEPLGDFLALEGACPAHPADNELFGGHRPPELTQ